jgi:signal peptidase II
LKALFISLAVVIIDQFSKIYIKGISLPILKIHHSGMYQGQQIPLLDDLFNITYIENPGIAFGISFGPEFKLLTCLFTLLAAIALVIYFFRIKDKPFLLRFPVALIIGGAVGNLIDRIFYGVFYGYSHLFYGKVVDFFDIRILNLMLFDRTIGNYVFNIADIAVTAGVIMLLFVYNRKKKVYEEISEDYISDTSVLELSKNKD